jgi:hypothetical protein
LIYAEAGPAILRPQQDNNVHVNLESKLIPSMVVDLQGSTEEAAAMFGAALTCCRPALLASFVSM